MLRSKIWYIRQLYIFPGTRFRCIALFIAVINVVRTVSNNKVTNSSNGQLKLKAGIDFLEYPVR